MSGHTGGPWLVANNGKNGKKSATFRIWRTDPDQPHGEEFRNRGFRAVAPHVSGEDNARLIAAAPDLLEVAIKAREMAKVMCDLTGCQGDDEWVWDFQKELEAAISKATGEA